MLCQKPNSDTELVIRYDCEDRLRQRFTNDEENDIWWEQGIVISKELSNSSDFMVNFFDNEDYDESESSLNVYEVLALPLLDDYLNHDVQFL